MSKQKQASVKSNKSGPKADFKDRDVDEVNKLREYWSGIALGSLFE